MCLQSRDGLMAALGMLATSEQPGQSDELVALR